MWRIGVDFNAVLGRSALVHGGSGCEGTSPSRGGRSGCCQLRNLTSDVESRVAVKWRGNLPAGDTGQCLKLPWARARIVLHSRFLERQYLLYRGSPRSTSTPRGSVAPFIVLRRFPTRHRYVSAAQTRNHGQCSTLGTEEPHSFRDWLRGDWRRLCSFSIRSGKDLCCARTHEQ